MLKSVNVFQLYSKTGLGFEIDLKISIYGLKHI